MIANSCKLGCANEANFDHPGGGRLYPVPIAGAGRDAQLSRQRLHHGVALIAGLVQNQRITHRRFGFRCKLNRHREFCGHCWLPELQNLYFLLPRARPVPVKSGVDGGPRRSTEVVLNAWGVGREASMTGLLVISEGHENLMIRSLVSPGPPQSRVSWAKPPREMPSKRFSLRNSFHLLNEAIKVFPEFSATRSSRLHCEIEF